MANATPVLLPEAVLKAISAGTNIVRAYREHLGYTIQDVAVTSGLTIDEIERLEAGHRFDKGYRDRVARTLGLPDGIFDDQSDIPDAA
ncbi:helix-turn-helix transcriptional regulator [Mesorhizobium sp. SP-1A]|jgi:hypothetical protein|uniref:helix-turn-helix domain-containing protein n=1 Tax=Mesorhizobium sp. SP-1A TaxID=3077840 RepID=UPI0028F701B1|nr:helix-turn-helix transcriptional regulator [Mesorhizobium sp. SP-1A]